MQCTSLLIILVKTTSTDYTATSTSFLFHTPKISIAPPHLDHRLRKRLRFKACNEAVFDIQSTMQRVEFAWY